MAAKPKTVADFMNENDRETIVRNRIVAQLAAMLKAGSEQHENEREFCSAARVNPAVIADFRTDFKQHVAYVPPFMGKKARYVWFADPKKVPAKFRYVPEKVDE